MGTILLYDSSQAANAGPLAGASDTSIHLSPSEKRRVILQIANPTIDASGELRTRISLYHAERHIKRGRAFRMNENGEPDPSGAFLVFHDHKDGASKVDLPAFLSRLAHGPQVPLPMSMGNETGTELWPLIPRYSGRPLADYLKQAERNQKREA